MALQRSTQPYDRAFNFSAGPCTLPVEVLEEARDSLMNYNGSGASVMELSHRGKDYDALHMQAFADLRELMGIPEDYKIAFLQGGASLQFTMLAMNFLPVGAAADYIVTGAWGKKAVEAAKIHGGVPQVIYDAKASNYDHAPKLSDIKQSANSAFVHMSHNETIQGVDFMEEPSGEGIWINDMSSNILSRPCNVSRYAMIYAGAQKNMGPAGLTVAIVRQDMIDKIPDGLPQMLDYRTYFENDSMYNTPPCWSIYVAGLVYKWVKKLGGLEAMDKINSEKAKTIYDVIDGSGFYKGHAQLANRSKMNITFTLPDEDMTAAFLKEAKENRLLELKGHRSVGGCRASIYNAFPLEGCQVLASFMKDFEQRNG